VNRRATGNARESAVADAFDALGYAYVPVKGSGARGSKMRARKCPVAGDGLAIPYSREGMYFQVEVGAHTPGAAFRDLGKALLPGFRPLLVQYFRKRGNGKGRSKKAVRRYYVDVDTACPSLQAALDSLGEG
jgi:hypothetical protein